MIEVDLFIPFVICGLQITLYGYSERNPCLTSTVSVWSVPCSMTGQCENLCLYPRRLHHPCLAIVSWRSRGLVPVSIFNISHFHWLDSWTLTSSFAFSLRSSLGIVRKEPHWEIIPYPEVELRAYALFSLEEIVKSKPFYGRNSEILVSLLEEAVGSRLSICEGVSFTHQSESQEWIPCPWRSNPT